MSYIYYPLRNKLFGEKKEKREQKLSAEYLLRSFSTNGIAITTNCVFRYPPGALNEHPSYRRVWAEWLTVLGMVFKSHLIVAINLKSKFKLNLCENTRTLCWLIFSDGRVVLGAIQWNDFVKILCNFSLLELQLFGIGIPFRLKGKVVKQLQMSLY